MFPGKQLRRFSDDAQINHTETVVASWLSNMTLFTIRASGIMKVVVADHNY